MVRGVPQLNRGLQAGVHGGHHSAANGGIPGVPGGQSNSLDQNHPLVNGGRGGKEAERSSGRESQKPNVSDIAIGTAGTVGSMGMMGLFFGNMARRPLGWIVGKFGGEERKTAFKSWVGGRYEAAMNTQLRNAGNLKQNIKHTESLLRTNGGDLPARYVTESRGGMLSMAHGNAMGSEKLTQELNAGVHKPSSVLTRAKNTVQPVAAKASAALGTFDNSRVGQILTTKKVGGLGALIKGIPKKLGKGSVFTYAAVAFAALSTGSLLAGNSKEKRVEKTALKNFAADVYGVDASQVTQEMISGPNAHAMVAEANKAHEASNRGRNLMGAASVASDAIMPFTLSGVLPNAFILPEMGLPWMAGKFAGNNPTLNMHQALKEHDNGKMQLAPEQRMQAVAHLLTTVPAIAKNGGVNNDYVGPLAYEIVSRGMNAQQIMHTLSDHKAFNNLTHEVINKVKAEQAKAEQAAGVSKQDPNAQKAHQAVSQVTQKTASATPNQVAMTAAPAAQIQASSTTHKGMVTGAQKAASADQASRSHAERVRAETSQNNGMQH